MLVPIIVICMFLEAPSVNTRVPKLILAYENALKYRSVRTSPQNTLSSSCSYQFNTLPFNLSNIAYLRWIIIWSYDICYNFLPRMEFVRVQHKEISGCAL